MLTSADQYQFIEPIAEGIKGEILPVVDGSPKVAVEAYEDTCFIAEAIQERRFWTNGKTQDPYNDFSPTDLTVSKGVLDQFIWEIKNYLIYGNSWDSNPIIPLDWQEPEYPLTDTQSTYGITEFYNSMLQNRNLPEAASVALDVNDLRYIYRELSNTKRYLLRPLDAIYTETSAASILTPERMANKDKAMFMVQKGSRMVLSRNGDTLVETYKEDTAYPYTEWVMNDDGGMDIYSGSYSSILFLIKNGFLRSPITGAQYYEKLTFYPQALARIRIIHEGETLTVYRRVLQKAASFAVSIGSDSFAGADSEFTLSFNSPIARWFNLFKVDAENAIKEEYPGCTVESIRITIDSFAFATSEVTHDTHIPDEWEWQPEAEGAAHEQ